MKGYSKKLIAALIVVVVMNSSCGTYEDGPSFSLLAKKSRLTGEWELLDIKPGGVPNGVTILFEFEKDGDFKMSYDYGSYGYSYAGEWEFEDQKETLEITIDNSIQEFEILRLTNKELTLEYNSGYSITEWEFEKQ